MEMRRISASALLLALCIFVGACSTVPITGRRQLTLVPDSLLRQMSFQSYNEFMTTHQRSTNAEQTAMVKRVGHGVQKAVEDYFAQRPELGPLKGYEWEFNLVEDPAVNAWAMPGGKVVVYTGILAVTEDEPGLAVVMGHEIAHAIAGHGNERMSQGLLTQMGGIALSTALKERPQETKQLFMRAYGATTEVGIILRYSRKHELEADRMGLIFMAMAGYDPNRAVSFWEGMAAAKEGQAPPEFLSTHPSDATRVRKAKEAMPEAMEHYKKR